MSNEIIAECKVKEMLMKNSSKRLGRKKEP
jgi:hypothetical protein